MEKLKPCMAEAYNIKIATSKDAGIIQELSHRIWPVAYGSILSPGQINYMLRWMYSLDTLVQQMQSEGITYVLLEAKEPIGFMAYGSAEGNRVKIHKLYILPEHQGKGLGKMLLDYAWSQLPNDCSGLVLQVNKHNPAREFYLKYGFIIEAEAQFDIGEGYIMDDYILFKSRDL
jgi:diamine N-acetyltransferase